MSGRAVWWLCTGFWCAVLLVVLPSRATTINGLYGGSIEYVTGGAVISDGSGVTFQGRTWEAPSRTAVKATDTGAPLRLGGNTINVNAARTLAPAAIGAASALVLRGLPVLGTGLALWDLWDLARVGPDGEGGLSQDPGVAPESTSGTEYKATFTVIVIDGGWKSTWAAACSAAQAAMPGAGTGQTKTSHALFGDPPGTCRVTYYNVSDPTCQANCAIHIATYSQRASQVSTCPASVDPLNPAYSIPAGLAPEADGKCRQARYHRVPVSTGEAATILEARAPPAAPDLLSMAQGAIAAGESIEASDRTMSGPTSVAGSPTTSTVTKPDGSTVTTTSTPTTNYSYTGSTVNYSTTVVTVTQTCVSPGSCTTETETTGEPPEETDACKLAPDSLGCTKLGTPPDEAPTWETINVPFEAEDLGFAGACPASNTWEVFGLTLTWGYEPVCEVAPMIRIALLLMASIAAIGIIFKETSA